MKNQQESCSIRFLLGILLAAVLCSLSMVSPLRGAVHIAQPDRSSPITQLANVAPSPTAKITTNPTTGRVQGIDFGEEPYVGSVNQFLSRFQHLFGITNFNSQLKLAREITDRIGSQHKQVSVMHLSYVQQCRGVPVFGAELRFHLNAHNEINMIQGATSPDFCFPQFATTPEISAQEAIDAAIAFVLSKDRDISSNDTIEALIEPQLSILDRVILRPSLAAELKKDGPKLAWQMVIGSRSSRRVRHQVFVDALQGNVAEEWDLNPEALVRRLWKLQNIGAEFWKEGDPFPTSDPEVNTLLDFTQKTYNFYLNLGYETWDGKGAQFLIVDDILSMDCPNAFWDGEKTNFCPGLQCDDVIVHEWSHAYTQTTHGLIYMDQPGALNEAYSDLMAAPLVAATTLQPDIKALRQVLRTPTGAACTTLAGGTDASLRWIIAGSCPGFPGGLRDMYNPPCYHNPAAVNDDYYHCGTDDNGGVHLNSGVPNHAFALLVDGGTFNGIQVRGIGAPKAAQMYWRAATMYQTPTTNFAQHADAVIKSCDDFRLAGTLLKDPFTGGALAEPVSQADCDSVRNAFNAVNIYEPACRPGTGDVLLPNPPPLCGSTGGSPLATYFSEDVEKLESISRWTTGKAGNYPYAGWVYASLEGYFDLHGQAFWAQDSPSDCFFQSYEGAASLTSPVIAIPSSAPADAEYRLAFDHIINCEFAYDGGILGISVNGGQFLQLPLSAFVFNKYNTRIRDDAPGNPLVGFSVWSGTPATGADEFYQTQVTLPVRPGDQFQLQWYYGIDQCVGINGWLLDNIVVYSCARRSSL